MIRLVFITFISLKLIADSSFGIVPDVRIDDIKKYNLGKMLFHDPNLSQDKTISCASCHQLNLYGTDNRTVFKGIKGIEGKLNSPTIFNSKFNIAQDGAGIAKTIKERTKLSFLNENEMGGRVQDVVQYIHADIMLYDEFIGIYGNVSEDAIFDSIAYFVENLLTPNSKFDQYLKGNKSIFNQDEIEGYQLFKKYGCISCHNGVNIGGNMYQKLGIFNSFEDEDDHSLGRYIVTGKEYDKNVFKVPSLRNIAQTAPYLHDGSVADLQTMIKRMGQLQLGITIPQNEISKLETFLITLTGDITNEY